MSSFSAYILSIVGIVFLGVLVDVIMPDGEMNKYIKGIFSIIALFVMISPVQKLFDKDFDIGKVFYDTSAIQIDNDFLEATNKQIKEQLQITIKTKLKDAGFENVDVEVLCKLSGSEIKVEKVIVDISKMVINTNMAHINKYTEIKNVITEYLNLEESDVVIND